MFAPRTKTNNYFIFKENSEEKILAHCYAHIENPTLYEPIVDGIINVYEAVYGVPDETVTMHPAIAWMKESFGPYLLYGT